MNTSFTKKRHILESNKRLENKFLSENELPDLGEILKRQNFTKKENPIGGEEDITYEKVIKDGLLTIKISDIDTFINFESDAFTLKSKYIPFKLSDSDLKEKLNRLEEYLGALQLLWY